MATKSVRVGVLGAGTMASGIAEACVLAGHAVRVRTRSESAADAVAAAIDRHLEGRVPRGELDADERASIRARLRVTTELTAHQCCRHGGVVVVASSLHRAWAPPWDPRCDASPARCFLLADESVPRGVVAAGMRGLGIVSCRMATLVGKRPADGRHRPSGSMVSWPDAMPWVTLLTRVGPRPVAEWRGMSSASALPARAPLERAPALGSWPGGDLIGLVVMRAEAARAMPMAPRNAGSLLGAWGSAPRWAAKASRSLSGGTTGTVVPRVPGSGS